MKFWLFDILACPIDKYYPLSLYIFSYQTKPEEIDTFINDYIKRDSNIIKKDKMIYLEKNDNEILIKDDIILEKNPVDKYLQLFRNSINEFNNVYDKSPNDLLKPYLKMIKSEIKQAINNVLESGKPEKIYDILPELFFLNRIKLNIEIETGILFCPNCKRWFPIIETIPQMLPDEFRKEEEEVKFLKRIRNLLDDEFFKQELKPFNI